MESGVGNAPTNICFADKPINFSGNPTYGEPFGICAQSKTLTGFRANYYTNGPKQIGVFNVNYYQ